MSKGIFMNGLSRTFHKTAFQFKKHSPEILVVTGIVGLVSAGVMACKATTKVGAILEETKEQVDGVHSVLENPVLAAKYVEKYGEEFTEEDSKKELAVVYAKTGLKLAKVYGPAIGVAALSITAILSGHNILRKRYVATAAAYTMLDTSFKDYRGRVIERFGKELDKELKYNIQAKEVEETVVDENGEEKTVKKIVPVADPNEYSEYARFFDDGCTGWDKNAEYNLTFLKQQQTYANQMLQSRGHLFLNEVYDMLGIPRTKAGNIVGWIYDEKNPLGDNFVDFGLTDIHKPKVRDFVNGYERTILLDFNVDGDIWSLMQ